MDISLKNIFLIDGLGAVATALLLSQLLARHEALFGVPPSVLYPLSGIAVCFAIYSLLCHFLVQSGHRHYLRAIAVANTAYCVLTAGLLAYLPSVSWLGIAYFIGEIIIILLLVRLEYRLSVRPAPV